MGTACRAPAPAHLSRGLLKSPCIRGEYPRSYPRDDFRTGREDPGAAAGNVRPVATPGTCSRRTSRKPKYVQYEDFRPARREHAPNAAP
ncbi:hypothetical protein FNH09_24125 [Streptomyces adustus]|uniref:Uncharacterized protein n=1 Tax=Streptomyces adustus TaxID=1609272 RepID=A0A5N8VG43_9ACTN|nr:hypothetical protein [Streptomyces adustus]